MAQVEAPVNAPLERLGPISFSVRLPGIALLLAGGLVLQLALAFLPGFGVDMGTFQSWSRNLADNGPWNFYNETSFTDYAPGYMWVLWLLGEANQLLHFTNDQYEYILKLPSIIANVASAYLLYRLLEGQKPGLRLAATALYVLFPAALLIGPVWGQVDSILAFFLLLSVYYISRDKPVHSAVAFTIGFLVKPQAIAALPFLALWIIRDNWGDWRRLALCTGVPLAVLIVLIIPFFEYEPWRLIGVLYDATNVEGYRVNSFWAYNFWNVGGLFDQGFRCDLPGHCAPDAEARATEWYGIATRYWGLALFASAITFILVSMRNARGTGYLALGVALSMMAFYVFLTRMHERYIFAAFLPFLLAAALIHSRFLWGMFIVVAFTHFVNLYHVYNYYYPWEAPGDGQPSLKWRWAYKWLEKYDLFGADLPLFGRLETVQFFSLVMVASIIVLLLHTFIRVNFGRQPAVETA
jgi:Gpi18-like mannosyltransferase